MSTQSDKRKRLAMMPMAEKRIKTLADTRAKHEPCRGGYILEGAMYRLAGRRRIVVDIVRVGPPDVGLDFTVKTILNRM